MNDLKEIILRLDGNYYSQYEKVHYWVSEAKKEDGHWVIKVHALHIAEDKEVQNESN